MKKIKILFVCMGNICRSPTAQGVFEKLVVKQGLVDRFEIDSAGTHAYHVGNSPDQRTQASALQRGIDLSMQRARRVDDNDFVYFDYILVMDQDNFRLCDERCVITHKHKIRLFMEFASQTDSLEVPDPYYGGSQGFDQVLDLVESASLGFFEHVQRLQG